MQIVDCTQGSPEWHQARLGIPTASNFKSVLAKSAEMKMRKTYMHRLAGEIITGVPAETYQSADMARGNIMEDEARNAYAFTHDADPQRIGFVRNGNCGCSPDSFLGADGILEIKTQKAELLVATIEADKFPSEHVAQCQGTLAVTGRKWADLCIYWPGMPLFVKRAYRDEDYIRALMDELARFNFELNGLVERIRRYGMQEAA